jgi:hypothetical protein
MEKVTSVEMSASGLARESAHKEDSAVRGVYNVECYGADGQLKWSEIVPNAVTTEGKNYLLDKGFAGSAFTATWYVGLINSGYTPTGSETYAAKGGTENTGYSQANRPTAAWSAASSGSKAFSAAATFSINATSTIGGMILVAGSSTKGDSTASAGVNVLWSIGNFTGGNRSVISGDTLNVSYTTSIT